MQVVQNGSAAFLQQAYRNNWQQYLASLTTGAPAGWDVCILTASDERQAAMYRRQFAWRREASLLPSRTRFLAIADPPGQRIGSGGATLRVLTELQTRTGDGPDLEPSAERDISTAGRILIIHSGGDSRRLPHCSALGKLFARLPRTLPDGRASSIFDELLISLSGLAIELPPGVLVASGDVLLVFDHLQLSFQRSGVTGVAAAASAEMGARHGVYVSGGSHNLRAYLHKPSTDQLRQWNAIDDAGMVAIDTGLAWLDAPTVSKFVTLAQDEAVAVFCGRQPNARRPLTGLNLYGDLLMPLAGSTTLDDYLADTSDGPDTPAVRAARQVIWEHLRGVRFSVERLQPTVFVHFGTSREYWEMVAASPELRRTCGWTRHSASWVSARAQRGSDGLCLINALVEGDVTVASEPGLLVDTRVAGPLTLQGSALVAGLRTERPLVLAAGAVVHQLPLEKGYVTRVFGLQDDPKLPRGDPSATFMNRPWAEWLSLAGVGVETVWPDVPSAEQTLWNAQLYPVVADRDGSLLLSLPLQDPASAPPGWRARWEDHPRLSLAESFVWATGARILADTVAIEDEVAARRFYAAAEAEQPAAEIKSVLGLAEQAVARRTHLVADWLANDDPVLQLRGYKALSEATGESRWEDQAFAIMAAMIEEATAASCPAFTRGDTRRKPLPPGRDVKPVRVETAARIDFGGGWTDTPPYSIERGGTVLNAAITLHGKYPIIVEAERLAEPRIMLESRDIGAVTELVHVGEVLAYANPADPFALLKAALVLRGIVPIDGDPEESLAAVLCQSGGVRLTTQTTIPRGSGLGTSSILAGAVLTSLVRLLRIELAQAQLFDEVLCLEQMLTTGGGWQDQVGGLTGGIKLVTTGPGLPQRITVQPVRLSPDTQAELDARLLLVYTGQQRLAKNLLQAVMRRWMARDPEMVWIQKEIARLAVAMRDALTGGDVGGFGALLSEHWALNKRMDRGCTNPFIDELFEMMQPYVDGGKLAGAGGGGFAIVTARDRGAVEDLSAALKDRYPGTSVAIWPCAVPAEGLIAGTAARSES